MAKDNTPAPVPVPPCRLRRAIMPLAHPCNATMPAHPAAATGRHRMRPCACRRQNSRSLKTCKTSKHEGKIRTVIRFQTTQCSTLLNSYRYGFTRRDEPYYSDRLESLRATERRPSGAAPLHHMSPNFVRPPSPGPQLPDEPPLDDFANLERRRHATTVLDSPELLMMYAQSFNDVGPLSTFLTFG